MNKFPKQEPQGNLFKHLTLEISIMSVYHIGYLMILVIVLDTGYLGALSKNFHVSIANV